MFGDAFASSSQSPEGDAFVHENPEFELPTQLQELGQRADVTGVHVDAFDDEKTANVGAGFGGLFFGDEKTFQVGGVVVPEVADG